MCVTFSFKLNIVCACKSISARVMTNTIMAALNRLTDMIKIAHRPNERRSFKFFRALNPPNCVLRFNCDFLWGYIAACKGPLDRSWRTCVCLPVLRPFAFARDIPRTLTNDAERYIACVSFVCAGTSTRFVNRWDSSDYEMKRTVYADNI